MSDRLTFTPWVRQELLILFVWKIRPEIGAVHGIVAAIRTARITLNLIPDRQCRTQSSAGVSRAPGWIDIPLNGFSRRRRPFPTQFKATPPPRAKMLHPGS